MTNKEPLRHPALLPRERLLEECETRRQRRSGPGGQHRNKVSSGVFLKHVSSGIEVSATERRSQHDNLRIAVHRLRIRLAIELRSPPESCRDLSERWKERLVGTRITVSSSHDDFPGLLAEALDRLATCGWRIDLAAAELGCSRTQLVNFVRGSPEAFRFLNGMRRSLGLKALQGE